ncbi:oxidoreductase [Flavobacterium sp. MC2016-06]|uniref:oxidoreductase n=1 Tax=Flavobacterium sp. MC2016-06 TaxID=2676308 RepID=UPI0012BAAF87|nr:oxidoreductase [Flavobacterium sp. MC2016-06]MBU3861137.1 SDR family NAD(P)-dependent oxidoreductase [Flavobacterium sp. MC2016-06]
MKKQKTWIITGANRGLGLEIAKAVLNSGDKVIATTRKNPESLKEILNNENALVLTLDVTNEANTQKVAQQAIDVFGKIDVLVNNAGFGLLSAVEEATDGEVRANYEANVFGLLNITRAVLPFMRKERSGHIINFSSVGGITGITGWGVYGSTKFAVEGITEAMAIELKPLGIHATTVEPGFFRTDFLDESSLTRTQNVIEDYAETVGAMRDFATQVNKKQPGDAKKLALAIVKLANAEKPPVHLPLGKDTLQMFKEKMTNFYAEIEEWHEIITGTDHDDVE